MGGASFSTNTRSHLFIKPGGIRREPRHDAARRAGAPGAAAIRRPTRPYRRQNDAEIPRSFAIHRFAIRRLGGRSLLGWGYRARPGGPAEPVPRSASDAEPAR